MLMPHTTVPNTWVRVAGNARMIRDREAHHWRCYIKGSQREVNLRTWDVSGEVTPQNMIPGSNPDGDSNGLVAWIDLFGDVHIDGNSALHIVARHPITTAPAE